MPVKASVSVTDKATSQQNRRGIITTPVCPLFSFNSHFLSSVYPIPHSPRRVIEKLIQGLCVWWWGG